jgi:hypothetical protein
MSVRTRLKDGILRIELDVQKPRVSASGKTRVVATTGGLVNTGIEYYGSKIVVIASAFIENQEDEKQKHRHRDREHKEE